MAQVIVWQPGHQPMVQDWERIDRAVIRQFIGGELCTAFFLPLPDAYTADRRAGVIGFCDDDGGSKRLDLTGFRPWDGSPLLGPLVICGRMPGEEGRLRGLEHGEMVHFSQAFHVPVNFPPHVGEAHFPGGNPDGSDYHGSATSPEGRSAFERNLHTPIVSYLSWSRQMIEPPWTSRRREGSSADAGR